MAHIIYNKLTLAVIRVDTSPIPPVEDKTYGVFEDATATAWPTSPGRWAVLKFVNNAMVWVDTRALADIKAEQWALIKARRDSRKGGGFKVGARWYHSDEPSRAQYAILLTTALEKSLPPTAVLGAAWKAMDGAKQPLTVAEVRMIRDVCLTLDAALFAAAETHLALMEASTDPQGYDFTTGWPLVYGE